MRPPLTLGHELCGTVAAVGSAVKDVVEGDYVSAESHVTCGVCFHCRPGGRTCASGRASSASTGTVGSPTTSPCRVRSSGATTARSFRPRSPASRSPSGTRSSRRRPRPRREGGRGLGCGPVGLFTIAIARAFGAGRLLASDHVPFRLELAKSLGADAVVDVDEVEDVPAWFAEHNEGIGMGVVFEMSGALRAIEDAFRIVRHGGNVVLFGIPARPATIDVAESLILQEPHRVRRQRAGDLGDLVHDALAARARRRRPATADHR